MVGAKMLEEKEGIKAEGYTPGNKTFGPDVTFTVCNIGETKMKS